MPGTVGAVVAAQRRHRNSSGGSFVGSSRSSSRSSDDNSSSLPSMTSMLGAMKKKATKTVSAASTVARQGMDAAKEKLGKMSRPSENNEEAPLHRADFLEEVQGIQETDTDDIKQLVGMGFSRTDATWALRQVGAGNVQGAALLLSSELVGPEVQARETVDDGELEGDTGQETSAGWWGEARWEPPFEPGAWVECHGLQSDEARALNGKVGQVIRYSSAHRRFVVQIRGEQKMIRAANLKKPPMTSLVHAELKASLKGTMGSMKDMRRKAGALLGTSKSKNEQQESTEEEVVPSVPSDPSKRDNAAKAAELRLAAAKARTGGTMEDWRRQRNELQDSRISASRQKQQERESIGGSSESIAKETDESSKEAQMENVEPPTSNMEPELLDVPEEELGMTMEEHQALMDEEFAMQQALALSMESGRDVLDQDRVEQACANAKSTESEIAHEANDDDKDLGRDLTSSQPLETQDNCEEHALQDPSCIRVAPSGDNEEHAENTTGDAPIISISQPLEVNIESGNTEATVENMTGDAPVVLTSEPPEVNDSGDKALQDPSQTSPCDSHDVEDHPEEEEVNKDVPVAPSCNAELQHAVENTVDVESSHENAKANVSSPLPCASEESRTGIDSSNPELRQPEAIESLAPEECKRGMK